VLSDADAQNFLTHSCIYFSCFLRTFLWQTNEELPHMQVIPNRALRTLIEDSKV